MLTYTNTYNSLFLIFSKFTPKKQGKNSTDGQSPQNKGALLNIC